MRSIILGIRNSKNEVLYRIIPTQNLLVSFKVIHNRNSYSLNLEMSNFNPAQNMNLSESDLTDYNKLLDIYDSFEEAIYIAECLMAEYERKEVLNLPILLGELKSKYKIAKQDTLEFNSNELKGVSNKISSSISFVKNAITKKESEKFSNGDGI